MPDFTDDFDRPDSVDVGNGWTEKGNGFQILNGRCVGETPGLYADLYCYRASPSADYEASLEWTHLRADNTVPVYAQIWVRLNDPTGVESAYGMFFDGQGTDRLRLIRDNNGSWTDMDFAEFTEVSAQIIQGDTYRFRIRVLGDNPVRIWAYLERLVGSEWVALWHGYDEDVDANRVTGAGNCAFSRFTEANNLYEYTRFEYTDLAAASNTHILGHGDSIAVGSVGYPGNVRSQIWPPLIGWLQKDDFDADVVRTFSYFNSGVFGEEVAQTTGRLAAAIAAQSPDVVYLAAVGTNDLTRAATTDVACEAVVNTILTEYSNMLSICDGAGVLLRVTEQPPHTINQNGLNLTEGLPEVGGELKQKWYKRLNSRIRQWGRDNNVPVGPNYEDLCWLAGGLRSDDDFADNPAYDDDGIHPTVLGYERIGRLYAAALVPPPKRFTYGLAGSFPGPSHYSWNRWILGGAAAIAGDADVGTLTMTDGDTADSSVLCLFGEESEVEIELSGVAGSVAIQYRATDDNFDRDAITPAWQPYVGPLDLSTNDFVQIRLVASGAATVESAELTWESILTPEQEASLVAFLDQFGEVDVVVLREALRVLERPNSARSLEYITRDLTAKRRDSE